MFCFSSIHVMDEWEMFPTNITCEEMIGEFGTVFIATMDASVLIKAKYVKQHDGMPLADDKKVKGKIVVVEIIGELPDKTSKKKNAKLATNQVWCYVVSAEGNPFKGISTNSHITSNCLPSYFYFNF